MADPFTLNPDLSEIKAIVIRLEHKVDKINDSVRDNSEGVAVLLQWRRDHEDNSEKDAERVDKQLERLSSRIWAIGAGDGLLAFLGTILHWFMP